MATEVDVHRKVKDALEAFVSSPPVGVELDEFLSAVEGVVELAVRSAVEELTAALDPDALEREADATAASLEFERGGLAGMAAAYKSHRLRVLATKQREALARFRSTDGR